MGWEAKHSRSSTVRAQHRRRFPPRQCAQCGAPHRPPAYPLRQDHIVNLAAHGLDVVANLQWLCDPCHDAKTERERAAGRANAKAKRGSLSRRYRDAEPDPGRIRP